MLGVF